MNPFVNFKKRGFLLPKGRKDLMDVLSRRNAPRPPAPDRERPIEQLRKAVLMGRRLMAEYAARLERRRLSEANRAKWRNLLRGMKKEMDELEQELRRRTPGAADGSTPG